MGTQKDFLLKLEETCGVKKPVWVNSEDTFAVSYESLVTARHLTVEHSIGRIRLTRDNSEIVELWIDVDNHDGVKYRKYKNERLRPAFEKLLSFGIPSQYIYPKVSGTGVHLHVFISDLPKNMNIRELFAKTTDEDSDARSKVEKTKLREYGAKASTGKGYASYASMDTLMNARNLPTFKEPEYPNIKLFVCSKEFLLKVACAQMDRKQSEIEEDVLVDYERDGNFMQLYKCPAIKMIAKKAEIDKHLFHDQRFFLMSQFLHFGEPSRKHLHEIMKNCSDYDEWYTQGMMNHAMESGYHPCTCKWAQEHKMPCGDCKGSSGKSPIKLAWTPLTLEEVKAEFHKYLKLHPDDDDIIDLAISQMLDPYIGGDLAWSFLVAPPSWAKTVILEAVHNPKWSEMIDEITDKTFISGKTKYDPVLKQDVPIEPLLPKLHMRTFMCKEFTTQLMQGKDVRNSVFGQLRSIYDENYCKSFGSFDFALLPEEWKHVRMGFFAGCTLYIDKYSTMQAILGERYLKMRMRKPDRLSAVKYARLNSIQRKNITKNLNKVVTRFIANLKMPKEFPQPNDEIGNALDHLAEFIVQCRAPVQRHSSMYGDDYEYEELKELGTRIVQQLFRRGWGLAILHETDWNVKVYRIIVRYAFDTLLPARLKIIKYLYKQKELKTQTDIQNGTHLGWDRTRRTISELLCIHVIDDGDGNKNYKLNDYIRMCLSTAIAPVIHTSQLSGMRVSQQANLPNSKENFSYTSKSSEAWRKLAVRYDDEPTLHEAIREARLSMTRNGGDE